MKYYVEGDTIRVNYCGEDLSASTTGKVVFVDKEHLIVRFEFCNPFAAYGLNRDSLADSVVSEITGKEIESLKKNEYDIFVDMKAPHTYLPKDICELNEKWATVWKEEMFWDNIILDEPINGYIVVEKDGKYNFIDEETDEYYSSVWFDRVTNWTKKGARIYTVVEFQGDCYKIDSEEQRFMSGRVEKVVLVTKLHPHAQYSHFEEIFGAKLHI